MATKKVTGYKGFDKDLKCQGKKYTVGKTFKHVGTVKLCSSGLHFVENPMDMFNYYPLLYTDKTGLVRSRYATVEASGVSDETESDSKRVAKSLKITTELSLESLVKASVKFILEKSSKPTSGYGAHSATTINDSIACAVGRKAKAKASKGSWIVLAEWYEGAEFTDAKPIAIKSAKVDGKIVKANQWYKLVGGKFVETDDSNE